MEASRRPNLTESALYASKARWQELAESYEGALGECEATLREMLGEGPSGQPGFLQEPERVKDRVLWCLAMIESALNDSRPPCKGCWPAEDRMIVSGQDGDGSQILKPCPECDLGDYEP